MEKLVGHTEHAAPLDRLSAASSAHAAIQCAVFKPVLYLVQSKENLLGQ